MEWDICGRSGNDAGNIDRCSDFGTCGSVTSWSLLPEPLKTYAETASGTEDVLAQFGRKIVK